MSLDLYLRNTDGDELKWINWLRNSFGLGNWAEDSTQGLNAQLHYVCNRWSYDEGEHIDRAEFKRVVMQYWEQIKGLKEGYFYFDLLAYITIIQPKFLHFPVHDVFGTPRINGSKFTVGKDKLMIPMEHFKAPVFNLPNCSLEDYKQWFLELVEFAVLLQDPTTRFYCSN